MAVFFNLSMNNVVNNSHGLQIEAGHGFVQYQDFVALRVALCNIHALTLTSGKFFKVTVLEVGNVHRFHRIIDGRPVVRTENTIPTALRITAHADHVFDGNWGTSWEDHRLHDKGNVLFDIFDRLPENLDATCTRRKYAS